ncbi:hypothetical protein AB0451_03315 [Streptomyces sp. NPDC052000]|uniref:DUF6907 domain-containing protein n=1 Tax=Streptomyces sp. NPDC052000 TaxID=3155676 RepID=UPI00344BE933
MTTVVPEQAVVPVSAQPAAPRLVPARVADKPIWLECADWCVLNHVAENNRFLEDVYHSGEMVDLEAPRFNGDPVLLAFVRLGLDSFGSDPELRTPFLVLEEGAGTGEGVYMRPEQAEEFANGLVAFAGQVLAMARTITASEAAS